MNVVDSGRTTPLHLSAMYGLADVSKILIANGADVNAIDIKKDTPLHKAGERHVGAYQHPFGAAEDLIQNGADVNALNHRHWTPLHIACGTFFISFSFVELFVQFFAKQRTGD